MPSTRGSCSSRTSSATTCGTTRTCAASSPRSRRGSPWARSSRWRMAERWRSSRGCWPGCRRWTVKPSELLLDGQQRMTSLYQSLYAKAPVRTRTPKGKEVDRFYYLDIKRAVEGQTALDDAIKGLPADRTLRTDFGRTITLDVSTEAAEFEQDLFPLNRVFDSRDWFYGWRDYWRARGRDVSDLDREFVRNVVDRIERYKMPLIRLDRTNSREAICLVFERVNVGGKKLDAFELVTAIYAADQFDLREDWSGTPGKGGRPGRTGPDDRGAEPPGCVVAGREYGVPAVLLAPAHSRDPARQSSAGTRWQGVTAGLLHPRRRARAPALGLPRVRRSGRGRVHRSRRIPERAEDHLASRRAVSAVDRRAGLGLRDDGTVRDHSRRQAAARAVVLVRHVRRTVRVEYGIATRARRARTRRVDRRDGAATAVRSTRPSFSRTGCIRSARDWPPRTRAFTRS